MQVLTETNAVRARVFAIAAAIAEYQARRAFMKSKTISRHTVRRDG